MCYICVLPCPLCVALWEEAYMAMRWSGYEEKDLVLMRSMGKLCLRLFKQLKPLLTMTDLVVYLVL